MHDVSPLRPDSVAAVDVRDDPRRRAQQLRALHEQWAVQQQVPAGVRTAIARAWQRQRPAEPRPAAAPLDEGRLASRRSDAVEIDHVLPLLRESLLEVAAEASNELVVCDAAGVVLWLNGPAQVRRSSERLGFVEGADWSEAQVGTNGLGTALADRRPIQVFGAEHSDEGHHGWVCTGAPIISPRTARPVGALSLSGPLRSAHPNTVALVTGAIRLAHQQLKLRHQADLDALIAHGPSPDRPHLLVDEHGWVARAVGIHPGQRVAVPGGLREGTVWSPGVGSLQAEPLGDGWLLRPVDEGQVRLELVLDEPAALRVSTGGAVETVVLGERHAAIVAALAAAPEGLGVGELARTAWPSPVSEVTVRAEISRLRTRLGALVRSRPYRLAAPCEVRSVGVQRAATDA